MLWEQPHLTIEQRFTVLLETNEERKTQIKTKISRLNNLCHHINPYEELPVKIKNELSYFKIHDIKDPFSITNKLILLLEDSIEELQSIENHENNQVPQ